MKLFLVILWYYCYNFHNISLLNKRNTLLENKSSKYSNDFNKKIDPEIDKILNLIFVLILKHSSSNLYLYFEKFNDNECLEFISSTILNPRNTINLMAKKFVRSGFESNSIETEDECIESNDIYILLKGNYSIPFIYNNIKEYKNQHRFFIERFTFDHELCLWHYCKEVYINNNSEIIKDIEPRINELFNLDHFELAGINYKMNQTTYYEELYKDDSYDFFMGIKYFLSVLAIIIIFSTLYTIYARNKEEIENNNEKKKKNQRNI